MPVFHIILMSKSKLQEKRLKIYQKPSYALLIIFIVITTIINVVKTQEGVKLVKTVEVYKCNASKLSTGFEIRVPSYEFKSEVILRIKGSDEFPGCTSFEPKPQEVLSETDLFYTDEEPGLTTINPSGVLDIGDHYYHVDQYCIYDFLPAKDETEVTRLKIHYCQSNCSKSGKSDGQLCIRKCCPAGKVVDLRDPEEFRCDPSGNKTWSPSFYDENFFWNSVTKVDAKNLSMKPHYFTESINAACNGSYFYWFMRNINKSFIYAPTRLLTNGKFVFINEHRSWTVLDREFCIDGLQNFEGRENVSDYSGDEFDQVLFICGTDDIDTTSDTKKESTLYMFSLFIASLFYLATALVTLLLWNKQNTHGWTVFSLVLSQFSMCLFIGNAHRIGLYGKPETRNSGICITNGVLAHFFTLASFTWLALINFDLWSTFRSLRHTNHKSVDKRKLALYSGMGWGLPLIVVIIGVILDHLFPNRESFVIVPEYGQHICYIAPWSQGLYVYYIMAGLLAITLTLGVLSCVKIYKLHTDTAGARSSSSAGDRKLFMVFAKLSVVLGTSWIFEFISWAASTQHHQHWIWSVFDLYNFLTALFIFIMFGCKRANLNHLMDKYSCLKRIMNIFSKGSIGNPSDTNTASTVVSQPNNPSSSQDEAKRSG